MKSVKLSGAFSTDEDFLFRGKIFLARKVVLIWLKIYHNVSIRKHILQEFFTKRYDVDSRTFFFNFGSAFLFKPWKFLSLSWVLSEKNWGIQLKDIFKRLLHISLKIIASKSWILKLYEVIGLYNRFFFYHGNTDDVQIWSFNSRKNSVLTMKIYWTVFDIGF